MPKGTDSKVTRVTRKAASGTVAGKTATSAGSSMATVGTAGAGTRASIALTPDQVAARAYEIYLEEGRPEGRDLEHWTRAEAELGRS
jgi:hypothetical protein